MKLLTGDCLEEMKELDDNCIDAIVTDPPYGLSFMGKKWDYDVPSTEIWKEAIRILKPGGHLLSFGGSRTYHRMAVNVEDAGFEIRDMITWVYGQGFPKALDINKRLGSCSCGGNTLSYTYEGKVRPLQQNDGKEAKPVKKEQGEVLQSGVSEQGSPTKEPSATNNVRKGQSSMEGRKLHRAEEGLQDDKKTETSESESEWVRSRTHTSNGKEDGEKDQEGGGDTPQRRGQTKQQSRKPQALPEPLPPLDGQSLSRCSRCERPILQSGYKTALKPAIEPIVLAMKPREGTFANNVLKWGVGGLNIDGSRVETEDKLSIGSNNHSNAGVFQSDKKLESNGQHEQGRFPANFIHDGSQQVLELFPDTNSGNSAARFFYCAKASKRERNAGLEGMEEKQATGGGGITSPRKEDGSVIVSGDKGTAGKYGSAKAKATNHHPTVKPIALMEYLINLISREGQTILDPFMGSGTTGIACKNLNREFIGIEMNEEYMEIAKARITSKI